MREPGGETMTTPYRADHVGSLLRPPELLAAREEHAAGRIDRGQLRAVEDEAIRDVVALQGDIEFTPAAMKIDGKLGVSQTIFGDAFRFLQECVAGDQTPKLTIPSPSM